MIMKKELTQFEKDLKKPLQINGKNSSMGFYNLVVSKRDFHLFAIGLRPNKSWKFNDAKKYFGIKGDKNKAVTEINNILNRYKLGEYN